MKMMLSCDDVAAIGRRIEADVSLVMRATCLGGGDAADVLYTSTGLTLRENNRLICKIIVYQVY